jgi:hypothetical protein
MWFGATWTLTLSKSHMSCGSSSPSHVDFQTSVQVSEDPTGRCAFSVDARARENSDRFTAGVPLAMTRNVKAHARTFE